MSFANVLGKSRNHKTRLARRRTNSHNWMGRAACIETLEDRRMLDAGDIVWLRQFGLGANNSANTRASAAGGNFYIAGTFDDGSNLPRGFLRAYDPTGEELWTSQLGSTRSVNTNAVTLDDSGIYVMGSVSGDLTGHTNLGEFDAFVIKYDFNGNALWSRQYGTSERDEAFDAATDTTGVYVLSHSAGQTGVRKFDHNGNSLWSRFIDIGGAIKIAVNDTGIYTVGSKKIGDVDFDAVVRGFDLDLQELWVHQFRVRESDSSAVGNGIAVDNTAVYVTGESSDGFVGGDDAFLRRYSLDGHEVWTRLFSVGEPSSETGVPTRAIPQEVDIDESGAFVVGTNVVGRLPSVTTDAFIRKFDLDGRDLWTTIVATPNTDSGWSVAAGEDGIYMTGETSGVFPGQSAGRSFVAKLEPGAIYNVAIDVKPGSEENAINLAAQGVIAVAILSTSVLSGEATDFDAASVDASSIVFAEAHAFQFGLEDIDNDGDLDLVLHFALQDTNLDAVYAQLVEDDANEDGVLDSSHQIAEVSLFGRTDGGDALLGFDELNLFLSGRRLRDLLDALFS